MCFLVQKSGSSPHHLSHHHHPPDNVTPIHESKAIANAITDITAGAIIADYLYIAAPRRRAVNGHRTIVPRTTGGLRPLEFDIVYYVLCICILYIVFCMYIKYCILYVYYVLYIAAIRARYCRNSSDRPRLD